MSSITIHNLDEKLEILIREKAKKDKKSINKTIQELLKKSFDIKDTYNTKKCDFSDIIGKWTQEDLEEFEEGIKDFETIEAYNYR